MKIQKLHRVLAPYYQEGNRAISEWAGYEITTDGTPVGWVAPVMEGRTRKWYVSHDKPVANRSAIDMTQFTGPGHPTLKAAIAALTGSTEPAKTAYSRKVP